MQPAAMVSVVQLVEHQVVVLEVAGSSPVTHPTMASAATAAMITFLIFRSFVGHSGGGVLEALMAGDQLENFRHRAGDNPDATRK
jgi:hypothetical protein